MPALIALTLAGAAFSATLFGLRWITSSPRFGLRAVEIAGNHARSDVEIERRLGLRRGQNLFGLELASLETRLERDPWIADAHLKRRLPNRLVVEVVEHRAAAVVDLGGLYLADEHGEVFKRASIARGETRGLPLITGIPRKAYQKEPEAAQARIRRGLEVARTWSDSDERPALGEVRLDSHRGITVYTYEQAVAVHLGRAEPGELAGRLQALDTAWSALSAEERRRVHFIHIGRGESPDRVTVALAAGDDHPWAK